MDPEKQQSEEEARASTEGATMSTEDEMQAPIEGATPPTEVPVEPTPVLEQGGSVSKNTIILLVVSIIIVVLMLLYIWGSSVGQAPQAVATAELQVVTPPKEEVVVETPPAPVPAMASDEVEMIDADLQALDLGVIDTEMGAFEAELTEALAE